jgi:hypothetical protein
MSVTTENTSTAVQPYAEVETNNSEVVLSSLDNAIAQLQSGKTDIFSTFQGADFDTQLEVVDAVSNALPLADNLGTIINLANVVVQPIDMPVDEKDPSKGTQKAPRIILVDADGTSYAAISTGVLKSLQNFFGLLGYPHTWPRPLPVAASEARSRNGFRFMTLTPQKAAKAETPKK